MKKWEMMGVSWQNGVAGFQGFVHHCLGFSSPRTVILKLLGVPTSSDRMRRMNIVVPSHRRGRRRFVPLSSTEQVPPGLFRWQGMALGSLLLPTIRNSTISSMSFQTFGKMMGGYGGQNCLNFEFFHLCLDSLIYSSWSKYTR